MPRNIVICFDGTWNKPDQGNEEHTQESNVRKLFEMCINDVERQVVYYDEGVGSHWYDKISGGLSGTGISKNIRQAYRFLARLYRPGDKVFVFGFSRGAYSARSLGGLIGACGLIPPEKADGIEVSKAYNLYRDETREAEWPIYKKTNQRCPIEVMGVWDTVGSLGIPVGFLLKMLSREVHGFHNVELGKDIKAGYHAVSIDEQRRPFDVTPWENHKYEGQNVEQVWFCGDHSNIGGGHKDRGLSNITLKWMIDRATSPEHGLLVEEAKVEALTLDPCGKVYDLHKFYYGFKMKRKAGMCVGEKPKVHASVRDRLDMVQGYTPLALDQLLPNNDLSYYEVVDEGYNQG